MNDIDCGTAHLLIPSRFLRRLAWPACSSADSRAYCPISTSKTPSGRSHGFRTQRQLIKAGPLDACDWNASQLR
jgi:hypothetical protein